MSNVGRIIDVMKKTASKQDTASGTYFDTAKALSSGATKIKMDGSGLTIEGDILYRSRAVRDVESGSTVIVAVSSGKQAYYVLDKLI